MTVADLAGTGVEARHAIFIQRQTGIFQAQLPHIGRSPTGSQKPFEALFVIAQSHHNLVALAAQLHVLGVHLQW